eukprot:5209934-Amphidinium_carterae.1
MTKDIKTCGLSVVTFSLGLDWAHKQRYIPSGPPEKDRLSLHASMNNPLVFWLVQFFTLGGICLGERSADCLASQTQAGSVP